MRRLISFFFISVFLIASCNNKNDENDVIILPSLVNSQTSFNAGDVMVFKIEAFSNKGYISSIDICGVTTDGIIKVLDTVINAESVNFYFEYTVPAFDDSQNLQLNFRAICSTGKSSQMDLVYSVSGDPLLVSKEYTMFAFYKNEKNCFSIDKELIMDYETSDSSSIDIFDYSIDTALVFSREWRSKTNLLFARFNDFDFANARAVNVSKAFNSSNKMTKIMDVSNNDVILVGKIDKPMGVLKIVNVFDEDNPVDDRYFFVFKKI